jgi:hypothetical protein
MPNPQTILMNQPNSKFNDRTGQYVIIKYEY